MTINVNKLNKYSGTTAFILSGIMVISLLSLLTNNLFSNWLILLFKLNNGVTNVHYASLHSLNLWDFVILLLVGLTSFGLYEALKKTSKVWSLIALIQPFLGIVLLAVTGEAGRSAVMGSVLVISFVMLKSKTFDRIIACIGILGSILLLIGDFTTTSSSHSSIVAVFIGIGYILLIIWFLVIGKKLLALGKGEIK